jgi:phage/plasmid-associated DNA primase
LISVTTLIFISEEGIGKDLFSELIENTIGNKYYGTTEKLEQVCGRFNSLLGGKLLMVLNETNPIESSQRLENIKAMITAKKLEIEEKYKSTIKCRNFCRFIFF